MPVVAYCFTRYQDGSEESAKVCRTTEEALKWFNMMSRGQDQTEFHLFELGKEIPIEQEATEEPQPPVVTKKWKLREQKGGKSSMSGKLVKINLEKKEGK